MFPLRKLYIESYINKKHNETVQLKCFLRHTILITDFQMVIYRILYFRSGHRSSKKSDLLVI